MRKNVLFTLMLLVFGLNIKAQTIVYSENFGTVTADNIPVAAHTFQNTNVTYSAVTTPANANFMARLRNVTPSTDYTGASGDACVFIPASVNYVVQFLIEGINTSLYENLQLSLGQHKGVDAASNQLKIEVSSDGNTWSNMAYSRPSGANTSNWILINPTGTIPSTDNLRIRFTNDAATVGTAVGFRIDDVKITGTAKQPMAVGESLANKDIRVFPNPVKGGILNIDTKDGKNADVEVFDISGKKVNASKIDNNKLNVSKLTSGTYLVKVKTTDKVVTEKVVINN